MKYFARKGDKQQEQFGIEQEFLLRNAQNNGPHPEQIAQLCRMEGIDPEFFRHMIEVVSDPFADPEQAVAQLWERRKALENALLPLGLSLGKYARFEQEPMVDKSDVMGNGAYYNWVYHEATKQLGKEPSDLLSAGIHINYSNESLDEEDLVELADWLRMLNCIFIYLSANSPHSQGKPFVFSERTLRFPNHYDVPRWEEASAFRDWVKEEETSPNGIIYPGKGRAWMPVALRFDQSAPGQSWEAPIKLVELRSLESGANIPPELITVAAKIIPHINQMVGLRKKPVVTIKDMHRNDLAVARLGPNAKVLFDGKERPIADVADVWVKEVPGIQALLDQGSPAEQFHQQQN